MRESKAMGAFPGNPFSSIRHSNMGPASITGQPVTGTEPSGGDKQQAASCALGMYPDTMLPVSLPRPLPETDGRGPQLVRYLASEIDMTMLLVTHQMRFGREFAERD